MKLRVIVRWDSILKNPQVIRTLYMAAVEVVREGPRFLEGVFFEAHPPVEFVPICQTQTAVYLSSCYYRKYSTVPHCTVFLRL